jgi:hypothetical protein
MVPDGDGNTFLHLLCLGNRFKQQEYDYAKHAFMKYSLWLSRNNDNQTAIDILRKFSGMATNLKGEPNYKRKMWEWLEMKVEED